uniref:Major facilitator superfamily (MFS) profile domain-containing protein n=1 Tax=Homalodisca liturata TaxID=320908 RepID=A0A1B6HL99_9HEMI
MAQSWSWLYVLSFLGCSGDSVLMSVLTSHLRSLGISHVNIGLLSSANGLALLISGPIVGSWSDIHGRREVLCLSTLVCALAYVALGHVSSLYLLFFTRCVLGTFQHVQTLGRALVADIVPADKQASTTALMHAFAYLSLTVGPLISGHVMEADNGFQCLTIAVATIFVFNAVLIYTFASPARSLKTRTSENTPPSKQLLLIFQQLKSINWKDCWMIFCIKFLFDFSALFFFRSVDVALVNSFQLTSRYVGYTISFYCFILLLSSLVLGATKFLKASSGNHLKYLNYTFWVMTVSLVGLYTVNNPTLFVVGLVPLACGHSLARVLLTEVLLEQCDDSCRGSVMGASSSVAAIARTVAPLLSSLAISWGGVSLMLIASSLVTASASLLTSSYSRQQVRSKVL